MGSIFAQFFGCCMRRSTAHEVIPDEQAHLIPPTVDLPISNEPNAIVIDHQKLRDKLGTIVRSKEGKMVNISSQLPFNLHNQALANALDPSSSRSTSQSQSRYGFPPNHQRLTTAVGLAITPVHSNVASHSRGPSNSRSSSLSSAPYDPDRRASKDPSESVSDIERGRHNPILNARLVKGNGITLPNESETHRGRPRVRAGSSGPQKVPEAQLVEVDPVSDPQLSNGHAIVLEGHGMNGEPPVSSSPPTGDLLGIGEASHDPTTPPGRDVVPPRSSPPNSLPKEEHLEGRPFQTDFKITETAPITISWD